MGVQCCWTRVWQHIPVSSNGQTIIRDWIETGTTVISDSWTAYRDLGAQGYTHRTVNQSIQFVNPETRAHTNTIESTWRSVKVFLGQYNRGEDYEFHQAHYIFAGRWKARRVPQYLQFLHLVANTERSLCSLSRWTRHVLYGQAFFHHPRKLVRRTILIIFRLGLELFYFYRLTSATPPQKVTAYYTHHLQVRVGVIFLL